MKYFPGRRIAFSLLSFALGCSVILAQPAPPETAHRGLDPANLDRSIPPTQNFYKFANGGWLAANPIPPEYARWGSFSELNEKNLRDLRKILEEAAASADVPQGSSMQKIGDFFASAMDSAGAEQAGVTPLSAEFDRIAAVASPADIAAVVAHMHTLLANPLFQLYVDQDAKNATMMIAQIQQGGLGLPDRDYYTREDEKSREIRREYLGHVQKMFQLLGEDAQVAEEHARTVMAIETRLAKASMTLVQQRDPNATYHKMTAGELADLASGFSWTRYFTDIGKGSPGAINVAQPDFFKEVSAMMSDVPLNDWKTYLRWQTVHAAAPWLSAAFVAEDFRFNQGVLTGAKEIRPRWKRALNAVNGALGEALGILYVRKHFSPAAKARAKEMVENLRAAFRERIKTRDWMSDATRAKALGKLESFAVKIGYPDKWKDYAGLEIDRGPILGNLMRANAFEFTRQLDEIGKPVDRTKWGMTPPTVNAYYNPTMNEIVFPAGILQPPFFDPEADDAVNYGGMGAVIGHEMTHGFDDQGSQFDADGNLKDWWTPTDKIAFVARSQRLEKQFDEFTAVDTLHANGKLTLGENIADLGGLTIAFAALKKAQQGRPLVPQIDGFTQEQRFFLAWAQIWRANYRPEELRRRVMLDVHALSEHRVNGPLVNMPEFHEAFGAKPGDPMVRPEKLRARIW
ncbi:MAG: M13 family metallopeptidase [Bacteroidota bacterium]